LQIRELLLVLMAAGDVSLALLHQRRAIDHQLEQIARLRTPKA
jgi:hypothetical protein